MVGPVVNPRWVATGWVIFNNKGKPVRQYEPYFSQLPEKRPLFRVRRSEPALAPYSSTIPLDRVIAVLHPNHSYEKAVVDPWQQVNFDTNDTVAPDGAETGDPRTDPDIKGYVAEYFKTAARDLADMVSAAHRGEAAPPPPREAAAAAKAAVHANTPTVSHLDTLGRSFIAIVHNKTKYSDASPRHACRP